MRDASSKALLLLLLTSGCRDLAVPQPPGPAILSGRVVLAETGTGRRRPVAGVYVELGRTNLSTRTNDDGRFTLGPITRRDGTLSLRLDADGDGVFERQRVIPLASLSSANVGDIVAGDLELTQNAIIRGRVLLEDRPATQGGHGGTTVFVPEGPFTTTTADNGDFTLGDLPDGPLQISAFHSGYAPVGLSGLDLNPGQLLELEPITLHVRPPAGPASVKGLVLRAGATNHAGFEVHVVRSRSTPGDPAAIIGRANTAADGSYRITELAAELYDLEVAGSTMRLFNVLLTSGEETEMPDLIVAEGQMAGSGAGASSDAGSSPTDAGTQGNNGAPVISVSDVRAPTSSRITLDARGTTDPEGDALRFTWQQQAGPTVQLSLYDSALAAMTTFTAPAAPTLLVFLLRVTDARGAFSEHTVAVSLNAPPTAVLPSSLIVPPATASALDGTASFDVDQTAPLRYRWSIVPDVDGGLPGVTLSALTDPRPTFTAPAAGTVFRVSLVVNDSEVDSAPTSMLVFASTSNVAPVAVAGTDLTADWTEAVLLDGRGSFDPNGSALGYRWGFTPGSLPCGQVADAGTPGTALFTAGTGTCNADLRLTVTDPGALTGIDQLIVRVDDRRVPAVVTTEPSSPAAAWAPVRVSFLRDLDAVRVPPIEVRNADGGLIVGVSGYDGQTRAITFVPRLPWPDGQALDVTLAPATSTAGLVMDAGVRFRFTADPPRLTPGTIKFTSVGASNPYHSITAVAGAAQRWLFYGHLGYIPQLLRSIDATGAETDSQMGVFGSPTEASRLKVEPFGVYADGHAWFANMSVSESTCQSGRGAQGILVRTSGTLVTSTFNNTPMANGGTFPAGSCATTRGMATALDRNVAVLIGTIEEPVAGTYEVRLSRCADRCINAVDGLPSSAPVAADWLAQTRAYNTTTEVLTGLSLDARENPPIAVWVAQAGTGRKVLRGAQLDLNSQVWTQLMRNGSSDLNGATGDAIAPTVRWRGTQPVIAWLQIDTGVTQLRVIERTATDWQNLGGALNSATPETERPRVALLNEALFVSWTEPVGLGRPHVLWFDSRAGAWRAPLGTAANGEIVIPTTCTGTAPSMSPIAEGLGLMLAYPQVCLTPAAVQIMLRDIR